MRRRTIAALAAALLAAPFACGIVSTELRALDAPDEVAPELPADATLLHTRAALQTDGGCRALGAKLLGTSRGSREVAGELARRGDRVAWRAGEAFLLQEPDGAEPRTVDPSALPPSVHRLLIQHAFLPAGVRRLVAFRIEPIDSVLDPRCW